DTVTRKAQREDTPVIAQPETGLLGSTAEPERAALDNDIWAGPKSDERRPASTAILGGPAGKGESGKSSAEIIEPSPVARVEGRKGREPFEPPRIEPMAQREPFESPQIEPIKPRGQAVISPERPTEALVSERRDAPQPSIIPSARVPDRTGA